MPVYSLSMKLSKAKLDKITRHSGLNNSMRQLKPRTEECVVLETAQDHRGYGAATSKLKLEGMKFSTRNGDNGTVLVWRVK